MGILNFATSVTEIYVGNPPDTGDTTTSIAPYTRRGIICRSSSPLGFLPWTSTSEVWISFYMRLQEDDANGTIFVVYDDNDEAIFRMVKNYNSWSNIDFDYFDGTNWVEIKGSWGDSNFTTRARWDFRFKIDATNGAIEIYKDGQPDVNSTPVYGDTTGGGSRTGTTKFRIGSWGGGGYAIQSAMIVADEPTLNMQYIQIWPETDGTYTEWTGGDFSSVNGVGISDTTLMESGTDDARYTYTIPTITTDFDTGYDVVAVCSSARAFKGSDTGKNLRHMVRSGTTDGFADVETVELYKKPTKGIFPINPATGVAWTLSEAKVAEIGYQIRP